MKGVASFSNAARLQDRETGKEITIMCDPGKTNNEGDATEKGADAACGCGPEMMAQMMEKCREAMGACCAGMCPPSKDCGE